MDSSAFDEVEPRTAEGIRKMFLAGSTMAEVKEWYDEISARRLRRMRDEIFAPLKSDPQKVKALANGGLLNANAIVRWKARAPKRKPPVQVEMFGG